MFNLKRRIIFGAVIAMLATLAGAPRVASAYRQWKHDKRLSMIERAKKAVATGVDSIPPELAALQGDEEEVDNAIETDGPDDAMVRNLALQVELGPRTAAALAEQTRIAAAEVAKWGAPGANEAAVAAGASVPGTRPWYTLGPSGARSQYNGTYYKGVDSGRVTGMRFDPNNSAVVYTAFAGGGLWKTANFNEQEPTWAPLTELLGALSVSGFDVDPTVQPGNPSILHVGLGDPYDQQFGAVARSLDGGLTWSAPLFLGTAAHPADGFATASQNIRDLRVDPTNGQNILVAADDALYRSTDGGATFGIIDLPNTVAYGNTREAMWSIVYLGAAVNPGTGVNQSSWLVAGSYACPGFFPPGRGGNSGTGCSANGQTGNIGDIWKSTDSGATWSSARVAGLIPATITGSLTTEIGRISMGAGAPTAGGTTTTIYAQIANINDAASKTAAYLKSIDGGASWTRIATDATVMTNPTIGSTNCTTMDLGHGQSWYNLAVAVDPGNANRAIFGGNLCGARTIDGGVTFSNISHWLPSGGGGATAFGPVVGSSNLSYAHADWHVALVARVNGQTMTLVGNDGGLFASSDVFDNPIPEKVSWLQPDVGIVTHMLYSVGSGDPSLGNPQTLFTGLQDNGTRFRLIEDENFIFDAQVQNWDQVIGGDGIGTVVASDPRGNNLVYWSALPQSSRPFCIPRLRDCSKATRIENGIEIANWSRVALPLTGGTPASSGDAEPFFERWAAANDGTNSVLTATTYAAFKLRVDTVTQQVFATRMTPSQQVAAGTGGIQIDGRLRSIRGNGVVASPFTYTVGGVPAHIYGAPTSSGTTGGGAAIFTDTGSAITMTPSAHGISVPDGQGGKYYLGNTFGMAFPRNPASLGGTDPRQTYLVSVVGTATLTAQGTFSVPIPATVGHLFMTNDNGNTWAPFVGNHTGNDLPNIGIYVVRYDPGDPTDQTIWVGTELGVYRTTDGGNTWARYGQVPSYDVAGNLVLGGLPLVRVWDLFISQNGSLVRAATYGRGMWEIYPTSEPATVAGKGDFDRNGVIDYFDMSQIAARLGTDPTTSAANSNYNASAAQNPRYESSLDLDLTPSGATTVINETDLIALTAKFGSAP